MRALQILTFSLTPSQALEAVTGKTASGDKEAFRAAMNNVLERRLFYIPSFKIYGSVAGFFDYGPPGCAIKQNITQAWRNHFILEEGMLEVECPAVTPEIVLKASGHVDRFVDYMVTDAKTGDCHRADHILEAQLEAVIADSKSSKETVAEARDILARVGELNAAGLGEALTKYGVKAPETGNDISPPFPFNLMFRTSIGPRGDLVGYLRPETAQGIFVNFRDLLFYNGGKLPFAAAQIGNSYRNEIAPRAGLLRVREYTQAEIEHFCNPLDKRHPKFKNVADVAPLLYSRSLQMGEEKKPKNMALAEAVNEGIIANETLAYFIGRTYIFCMNIGLKADRVRFRQHLQHEMAHYAADCWDLEVDCSYGWVECAGLADRSAFDLTAHAKMSKVDLEAFERFPEPRIEDVLTVTPNKKDLGKAFKKEAGLVMCALENMSEADALAMADALAKGQSVDFPVEGNTYKIEAGMVEIQMEKKKLSGRNYVPGVIEPSFGIGRLLYCVFEHSYYVRDGDENRVCFAFTPLAAPIKATVFPLMSKPDLNDKASEVAASLTAVGLSNQIDTSGATIGKRYARTDELGVPFAITIDYGTLSDGTATVRDRDSMSQVRVQTTEIPALLRKLTDMLVSWEEVASKYPAQAAVADGDS